MEKVIIGYTYRLSQINKELKKPDLFIQTSLKYLSVEVNNKLIMSNLAQLSQKQMNPQLEDSHPLDGRSR